MGSLRARSAVVAIPLVLVPALGVVHGGFQPDAWVWAGALSSWACAVALVMSGSAGALRRAWTWAAASGGLLVWTLASALWSVHPAQSVLEARRTLLYTAVVLALLLLARREASHLLVPATHAAISILMAYALLRYLLGARHRVEFEGHLLSQPLGYANAVGILAALGSVLAVGIVAQTDRPGRRAAAAATVPPLALALELSGSTASWLALGAGLAIAAAASTATVRQLATLAAVAPPTAILVGLGSYSRLASDLAAPRLSGAALAGAMVGCAVAAAAIVAVSALPDVPLPGSLVLVAVIVLALGGAAAVASTGAKEPRASYFHVAWHHEYLAHPLLGSGGGTFGRYWLRFGKPLEFGGALDAHSLYLETLAELGPVGLMLLAGMLLVPLRGAIRRRHAPYLPAAAGAYAAFLVHAGLDWDWEMPVVVVAALCCAATVAAAELEPERPLGARTRAAILGAALVLGGCAIAGARSSTVPEATPGTAKAPRSGAFSQRRA